MKSVLGLDLGSRRVGVAIASLETKLPRALVTLEAGDQLVSQLKLIIKENEVDCLVVGWPRGLDGQPTAQTKLVDQVARELKLALKLPLYYQDEAVTSLQARAELESRGKAYDKSKIDQLAAVYILEDFLRDGGRV